MSAKVAVPERVDAYFSRPRLLAPSESESGCVVVLAPGGFGKTSLLAEIHRRALGRRLLAAWLSVDEDDTEEGIGTYLAYAFEHAGLDISSTDEAVEHGLAVVARSIEAYGEPCLLVLDEVERVSGEAVAALDFFLRHRPGNLRVAMGMRENPGLDLASVTLDGPDLVLTADHLRFSRQETIEFFDGELSRRRLAEVTARTEGWPVALRLYRNMQADETGLPSAGERTMRDLAGDEDIAANWLGARLLRNVANDERDFLLDVSLFDWIDIALVDQVLGRRDSRPRMRGMLSLQGLIQPMGGDGDTLRLHPLLKHYCAARLQREDADRYRQLHRNIAVAMERNGYLLPSIRHASAAGDSRLVGDILDRAGGLRLYLHEGSTRLAAAERFLTPDVLDGHPRLALLHCRILTNNAKLAEARNLYESVRAQTHGFTRDPNADSAHALHVDATVIAATLVGYGCMPVTDELIRDVKASLDLLRREDAPDPAVLAVHNAILFIAHYQRARFDIASEFAVEAKRQYALCGSHHGDLLVTLHEGLLAMAQGRGGEAQRQYERAKRIAVEYFPHDSSQSLILDVLSTELDVEHNRTEELEARISQMPIPLRDVALMIDVRSAALDMAAEWSFDTGGAEEALQAVEESREFALSEGLAGAVRHLSALRVVYLIEDERVDQAARAWRGAGLPNDLPGLLDLEAQSWREMEAISCARIRLLTAQREFEAAREMATGLAELARKRRLARTRMRCLALWIVLESRAKRDNDAAARLIDYVRAYRDTGYIRPLARARESGALVLEPILELDLPANIREMAKTLLQQLGPPVADSLQAQRYTYREIEVLQCLARGERNKEIARRLGITEHGVRYHLKNLYRKLGATSRVDAVRRARSAGMMDQYTTQISSRRC
ncbi:MAG: LuxR C-terminal-related transcriptional regulator [Gammaproteobacteria bacterium]|nr:LuxR C-terminal-related transcriptional regulator [Gammaproteobacteria bacterium]